MNWQKWLGIAACIGIIASCFMQWAWYPDVQRHFTGFDTAVMYKGKMVNYYGRPGLLLCTFAGLSLLCHLLPLLWLKKANLLFAALIGAFAIKNYFTFSAAYNGIIPQQQPGIYVMVACAVLGLIAVIFTKAEAPVKEA